VSAIHRKTRVENALGMPLAIVLAGVASIFLRAGVGFGITHGEMSIDAESRQLAAQLNRAGNIALVFFLATALGASWLLLKSGPVSLPRLHWSVKFSGLLAAVAFCSWVLVMLSLTAGAPDLIINLERSVSSWLMSVAA